MKRAFMSELAIARTLIPSIAGVGLFIFVVLTLANASDGDSGMSAGACAVSAMSPIIIMNSLAGYDNQNGWGGLPGKSKDSRKPAGSAIGQRCRSRAKTSSAHATCALLFSRPSWHAPPCF